MIFSRFLILFGLENFNSRVYALPGRVKRGATINCDIVVVDCKLETIEISLNETCRSQEYQVVPPTGAGLFVTNSKISSSLDMQSADERRSCMFNSTELGAIPSLPDITPCVVTAADEIEGLNAVITSSGWLHFSPAEVDFEIKLMEPVQIECFFDSLLNLEEEEISISEADVSAVKEEINADDIISDFGLSLHTSPFDIETNSERIEKSYFLGDTISVRVDVQNKNPYYTLYLRNCDITSGSTTLNIYNNFCPSIKYKEILGVIKKSETWFTFTVFKLNEVSSIDLKCDLAVLTAKDPAPLDCDQYFWSYEDYLDYYNEYAANRTAIESNATESSGDQEERSLSLQSSIQIQPHLGSAASKSFLSFFQLDFAFILFAFLF